MLYYLSPGMGSVDPLALRDPQKFVPSKVRGFVMFPEFIEEKLRPIDDFSIEFVQFFVNSVILLGARLVSMFFSVEVIAFIPYVYLIIGLDRAYLQVLSQCISLLVISQLPKRFIWRFRPYMVNRAKMATTNMSSSFPARTVSCGIVFTYIFHSTFVTYLTPFGSALFLFYMLLTCAYMLVPFIASLSRIALGAHYPSDCVVGAIQGVICCIVGEMVYSMFLSCSKELIRANELVAWNWSNFDYNRAAVVTVIAFVFILVSGIRCISLWRKIPLLLSIITPSIIFSSLICTTPFDTISGQGAHYLSLPITYIHHYVLVMFTFGVILMSYRYLQIKQVGIVAAIYFLVVHLSLLTVLMLHRFDVPSDNSEVILIKNGIGDIVDLESS